MNKPQAKTCLAINAVLTQALQSRWTYVLKTECRDGSSGVGYYTQVSQMGCGTRDIFFRSLWHMSQWVDIMQKYEKYMGADTGENVCPDCFHVLAKCGCGSH